MRDSNCKFKVTKNKIVKLALKNTKFEHLDSLFTGPTAIGSSEDAIAPAKVLVDFSKETEKIKIIGGGFETKSLSVDEINNLASLPSLDEVRSKLIGLLMAGPTKLVRTIKEPPSRMARILATKNN
jgi:large subunit ribosomal protein L10